MTKVGILVSVSNFENPHFIAGFITYSTQNLMAVKNFHLFCGLVIDAVKEVPGNLMKVVEFHSDTVEV